MTASNCGGNVGDVVYAPKGTIWKGMALCGLWVCLLCFQIHFGKFWATRHSNVMC